MAAAKAARWCLCPNEVTKQSLEDTEPHSLASNKYYSLTHMPLCLYQPSSLLDFMSSFYQEHTWSYHCQVCDSLCKTCWAQSIMSLSGKAVLDSPQTPPVLPFPFPSSLEMVWTESQGPSRCFLHLVSLDPVSPGACPPGPPCSFIKISVSA